MNNQATLSILEKVGAAHAGINQAAFIANSEEASQHVKDALTAARKAIEVATAAVVNQATNPHTDTEVSTATEQRTFEQDMQSIASAIGAKYSVTTLEWHVLNYVIETDHGNGMGPDTKELREELKIDGQQLGGVLTSLQNKDLIEISDSTHMIGVDNDIVHPSDNLKQYVFETINIAIGNY